MTRLTPTADGTYHFLEFTGVGNPYVLRVVVVDGREGRDEMWSAAAQDWVPTRKIDPYRSGRGDNDLVSATGEQIRPYLQKVNEAFAARSRSEQPN